MGEIFLIFEEKETTEKPQPGMGQEPMARTRARFAQAAGTQRFEPLRLCASARFHPDLIYCGFCAAFRQ